MRHEVVVFSSCKGPPGVRTLNIKVPFSIFLKVTHKSEGKAFKNLRCVEICPL